MSGCSRRPAKDARRSRSSGACWTRPARGVPFDEMAVFLRTPQQYLGLLEHACARGGVPVYFDRGTRRPDPAGRAFVALAVVRRRRAVREALRRVSVARPGATAVGVAAARSATATPRRRRRCLPTKSSCAAIRRGARRSRVSGAEPAPVADSDDDAIVAGHAALAVEMGGADRRVGGGRRPHAAGRQGAVAPPARRARRRLPNTASRELTREEPESARIARFERDLRNLRAPARVRAADRRRAGRMAGRGDLGRVARAVLARWRQRALSRPDAGAADAGGSAADGGGRSGHARRGARRAARSPGHARLGSAGAPLRPAVRRHAASGARPVVPRGLRARAGRARGAAASARGSAAARRPPPRRSIRRWSARTIAAAPSGCC